VVRQARRAAADCVAARRGGPARTVEVNQRTYNNVDWGYAATIHKAQGVTVARVRVLASPTMVRHDGARRVSCNDQLLAALLHKR